MNITLKSYALHSFSSDGTPPVVQTVASMAAVKEYVLELVGFLGNPKTNVREFEFPDGRQPEAKSLICSYPKKKEFEEAAESLAKRLHEKQVDAENRSFEITQGDLLSVFYSVEGQSYALLSKLEQVQFLNRVTLEKNAGFPFDKNRLLKTCLCELTEENGVWEIGAVSLYDSNSVISKFWWHDFLELAELTDDDSNSKRAYAAWKDFIDKTIRPTSKADALIAKNSIGGIFKSKQPYVHSDVVDAVLTNYVPENPALDMKAIAAKAQKLPQQSKALGKRFDANFQVSPSACRIRLAPIRLTDEIDLILKAPVADLKNVVMPITHNQKKGVFIASDAGHAEVSAS